MLALSTLQDQALAAGALLFLGGCVVLPILWFWRHCRRSGLDPIERKRWYKRLQGPFVLAVVSPLMTIAMLARSRAGAAPSRHKGDDQGPLDRALTWLWENPMACAALFAALSVLGMIWLRNTLRAFRRSTRASAEAPEPLMTDLRWTFQQGPFASEAAFQAKLREDNPQASKEDFEGAMDAVAVDGDRARVQFFHWDEEQGDVYEPQVPIRAKNLPYLTQSELLFQVHNAICKRMEHEEDCFFEGFLRSENSSPSDLEGPLYFLRQGR